MQWGLGSFNTTGLSGKASVFQGLPDGVFAVSETQLSSRGRQRFSRELLGVKSKFRFYAGADAKLRSRNMATHTGVGFMSTSPCRLVSGGWDTELYSTGRIQAATFMIGNVCVGGGVICYSGPPHCVETRDMTNDLLVEMSRQLVEPFAGPAFVAQCIARVGAGSQRVEGCPNMGRRGTGHSTGRVSV